MSTAMPATTLSEVTGHGGVRLVVRSAGPEGAPPIILIHGWSQHSLSWLRQMAGPLADEFRLIVPDLRGHGASDKPDDRAAYDNVQPWAGDVAALVATCDRPPLLVGWSMGGRVIGDYLSVHGDAAIAGVVMVGASATGGALADPAAMALRSDAANALGAYSEDQAVALPAIVAFVKTCAASPIAPDDLAFMAGLNMLATPLARQASRVRDYDHRPAYAAMTRPACVIHGAEEALCVTPLFEEMVAALPSPTVHVYDGVGHMPFWEATERFDADLAAFAHRVFGETA